MPKSASHETLVNYCYRNLRDKIIHGEFAPGEKLQIAKLKTRLNAGPTPIREALARLNSSGLIYSEENKGFWVKDVSESEIRDIYSTFNKIEILALSQAIDLGDSSWAAAIVAALYKLGIVEKGNPPIDPQLWLEQNYEFHSSLVIGCNSPCLMKIRENLYRLFDRYCYLSFLINKNSLVLNHKDHCDLAAAVIARDKETSCKLLTLHLENSLEQVIERLKKNKFL